MFLQLATKLVTYCHLHPQLFPRRANFSLFYINPLTSPPPPPTPGPTSYTMLRLQRSTTAIVQREGREVGYRCRSAWNVKSAMWTHGFVSELGASLLPLFCKNAATAKTRLPFDRFSEQLSSQNPGLHSRRKERGTVSLRADVSSSILCLRSKRLA